MQGLHEENGCSVLVVSYAYTSDCEESKIVLKYFLKLVVKEISKICS